MPTPTRAPKRVESAGSGAAIDIAHDSPGQFVIGSASYSATPQDLLKGNWGLPDYAASLTTQLAPDTITVSAVGKVAVVPDEARIVVFPEEDYGPYGPARFTKTQEQEITEALAPGSFDYWTGAPTRERE